MQLISTGRPTTIVSDWGGGIGFWMQTIGGSGDEMIWVVVTAEAANRVANDILPPEDAEKLVQRDREFWERAANRAFDQHGVDPRAPSPEGKPVLFVYPSDLD